MTFRKHLRSLDVFAIFVNLLRKWKRNEKCMLSADYMECIKTINGLLDNVSQVPNSMAFFQTSKRIIIYDS